MTVSLEEMLEDEDMLSRWLPGSSLLHSRSFAVASVDTSGTTDWTGPLGAGGARTWPSLFALLIGVCPGRSLNRALLVWARGAAWAVGVPWGSMGWEGAKFASACWLSSRVPSSCSRGRSFPEDEETMFVWEWCSGFPVSGGHRMLRVASFKETVAVDVR